jgi:hypothetical protein
MATMMKRVHMAKLTLSLFSLSSLYLSLFALSLSLSLALSLSLSFSLADRYHISCQNIRRA